MSIINQRFFRVISISFVVIAVLIGLLWIRWLVSSDAAWKSVYTCVVIWSTILIISSIDWILALGDIDPSASILSNSLKVLSLIWVFVLSILAVLSIWEILSQDVQWKAYSSVLLIFMGVVVWGIIEKRFVGSHKKKVVDEEWDKESDEEWDKESDFVDPFIIEK
jgi:hypothetical protein